MTWRDTFTRPDGRKYRAYGRDMLIRLDRADDGNPIGRFIYRPGRGYVDQETGECSPTYTPLAVKAIERQE